MSPQLGLENYQKNKQQKTLPVGRHDRQLSNDKRTGKMTGNISARPFQKDLYQVATINLLSAKEPSGKM